MTTLDQLMGKSKPKEEIKTAPPKKESNGFSLNLGGKKNGTEKESQTQTHTEIPENSPAGILHSSDAASPFDGLADTLKDISFDLSNTKEETTTQESKPDQQFQNPTLEDVSKFVFEEQPDASTEEITETFSEMIDELSVSTGDQVPKNVARCLKFIKEHAFLAEILKPEAIGVLVTGLRKSYGFIVKTKSANSEKKQARAKKQNAVLDSLADFSI